MTEQNPAPENERFSLSRPPFEPNELLAELKTQAEAPKPAKLSSKLAHDTIKQHPILFQPREMNQRHISELVGAIRMKRRLEPVTVIQVGPATVLIDGHHRMAAYKRAGVDTNIPVTYFKGSLDDAVLEAGKANSKAKLPMTNQDRQNYAWRLVVMGQFSKQAICEAAGISDGQVAIMRRITRKLGNRAFSSETWWQAQRMAKEGMKLTWDADEVEERKAAQARIYADRLSATFFNKLTKNPEIAAMALEMHFGDKLEELCRELQGYFEPENDDF